MTTRTALVVVWALAATAWPAGAEGQNPHRGTVRGAVRTTLGDRIPYAVVTLEPGVPRRFTDDSGSFAFPGLAPGTYHLGARQVGYKPFDTTVVVTADSAVVVAVALEHVVVQLDAIQVVARSASSRRCTAPGPPDPAVNPEFAAVFDQLRQNAERYWLLADSYPAIYRMERRFGRPDNYNRQLRVDRTDTVELRTDARWHYAPGRVATNVLGARDISLQINLPGLPDFADSVFLANHCFRFAGFQQMEGRRYARLDFSVADAVADPDASGSAYLDPETYLVRFTRVRLTRPDQVLSGLEGVEATEAFREVVPSLVVPDRISSMQTSWVRNTQVQVAEEQRTVGFSFLRPLPAQRP